ncbi:hypothetical protein RIF29_41634 [Crotalaria pallida]|uniref:Peroxidase n=1 Tax=Crotalaria pallida TaxID=3830 RepID=A0AAN9HRQ1_CROPI
MEGGNNNFSNKTFLLVFLLLAVLNNTVHGQGTCRLGFYSTSCPSVESTVRSTVESYFRSDPEYAAGLLRMHFHDCFVRGCDGSVLIDGANGERQAGPNRNLKGYDVIDDAKAKLEAACPGVVSCADILTLAARDSVVLSGGVSWQVATGRRDGRVSIGTEALNLPGRNDNVTVQKKKFSDQGLNLQDLVILTGGHTIGTTSCRFLAERIQGPNGTTDPSIDPSFLPTLQQMCPQDQPTKRIALDTGSQFKFDTSYFANLKKGHGILLSDQLLWTDASTRSLVQKYIATGPFNLDFGKAMVKLANIGVKTGLDGEIRKICSAIN